ncbi:MAG: hypothetical protein GEV06_04460 [Luteitalea sp.]|nr:hypothetical protein [Luteitalea sp.]
MRRTHFSWPSGRVPTQLRIAGLALVLFAGLSTVLSALPIGGFAFYAAYTNLNIGGTPVGNVQHLRQNLPAGGCILGPITPCSTFPTSWHPSTANANMPTLLNSGEHIVSLASGDPDGNVILMRVQGPDRFVLFPYPISSPGAGTTGFFRVGSFTLEGVLGPAGFRTTATFPAAGSDWFPTVLDPTLFAQAPPNVRLEIEGLGTVFLHETEREQSGNQTIVRANGVRFDFDLTTVPDAGVPTPIIGEFVLGHVEMSAERPIVGDISAGSGGPGTPITITGSGFRPGETSVDIGGVPATDVEVESPTELTATVPELLGGTWPVNVTTPVDRFSLPDAFTSVNPTPGLPVAGEAFAVMSRINPVSTPANPLPFVGPVVYGPWPAAELPEGGGSESESLGLMPAIPGANRIPGRLLDAEGLEATTEGGPASPSLESVASSGPFNIGNGLLEAEGALVRCAREPSGPVCITSFVNLTSSELGDLPATPEPNTSLEIPGLGEVVLNFYSDVVEDGMRLATATGIRVNLNIPGVATGDLFFLRAAIAIQSTDVSGPLVPNTGPETGGTIVTIPGTGFIDPIEVTFGGVPVLDVTVDSATQVTAITPPHAPGAVDVVVTSPGGSETLSDAFTYTPAPAPTASSIVPTTGPVAGGILATITGTNFFPGTTVTFGTTPSPMVTVLKPEPGSDEMTLQARVPAASAPGPVSVVVTTPRGSSSPLGLTFTYTSTPVTPPSITGVSPPSGDAGTEVTVSGAGFDPGATVTICSQVVTPDSVSGTQVVFAAPTCSTGGPQDVTVTNPNGGTDTLPASFAYPGSGVSLPAISSVSPSTGPVAGGTLVTISGANFLAGTTTVHFGGTPSPAVNVLNPTTLQVQLPAAAGAQEGAVDVVVATPIGSVTLAGGFTYTAEPGPTPPPSITDISPSQGNAGTVVTITGTGFQPDATVTICAQTVTPTGVGETAITFTAPFCLLAGAQNVTVTNLDGTSDTVPAAFTYGVAGPPTIDSVAPPSGPVGGGTVVTVTGSNFGGAAVTFGGVEATTVVLSSTTLLVDTPPAPGGSPGLVDVVVTTANGSATLDDGFAYFGSAVTPPEITSLEPTTGDAGTDVTITGTGFQDGATVTICGQVVATVFMDPTEVVFAAPLCLAGGPQDVSVMNPDFGSDTLPAGFTYAGLQPPTASSINPTFGPAGGGTIVTITGTNFVPGTPGTTVAFGAGTPQSAVILNSTTLQVTTPPAPGPVPLQVDVTVTTPGGSAVLPDGFTYVSGPGAPPTITDILPPEGDAGTPVTITGAGFQLGATVTICGRMVTPASVSAMEIVFTAPLCPAGGPQTVTVTNPDGGFATQPGGFTYPPAPPTIDSITPQAGPVTGGITATITGTGFVPGDTEVSFGGASSPAVSVLSSTTLQVELPPAPGGNTGPVDVVVTTSGGSDTLPNGFSYIAGGITPPSITDVFPITGSVGTPVTVTGDGFQPGVTVTICNQVVVPVTASTTLLTFIAPGCPQGGPQAVTALNPDGGSDTVPDAFTYGVVGPPTIVSVTPPSGPVSGGTTVTITGTNFNGTSVAFGGVDGTNLTVLSSTTLVVDTPPAPGGSTGSVDVVVTTENGSAMFQAGFTYFGTNVIPPEITSVDPASGNASENVTVMGTGFQLNATVTICGQIVATVFGSATEVSFTAPSCLVGGPQDVTLRNPDFGSDTLPAGFTYGSLQPPTVSNINPTFGPPDTVVTITGTNFVPGTTVTFGSAPPSPVIIFNSTTVQVTTPPAPGLPPLVVNVTVTTLGGDFTLPNGFTYSGPGTPVDSDGDGMSDEDEINYGLDPNDPTDAQEDPDGDGIPNIDEVNGDPPSHPRGFFVQYLAEGAIGFFNTQVGIFNPNGSVPERVLVTLFPEPPHEAVGLPFMLDPMGRQTIDVGAELADLPPTGVSIRVESDEPVSTMRQMLWDNPTTPYGGTLESGSPMPSRTWFFGEGATYIFDLFYLIVNPNLTPANVTIRYLRAEGDPITQQIEVPASSRSTILANQVPGLEFAEVSAVIESDQPVVAERAMYLSLSGRPFDAGQAGVGVTEPSMEWFLAEGATNFFDTFVSMGNPNDEEAHILITYQLPDGSTLNKQHEIPAQSRRTILVESEDPRLVDTAMAISVRSSNVPIIVERAMWWGPTAESWYESHSALGSTETGTLWAVAEGASGGPAAEDTYLLVSNTSPELAWVRFTICYDGDDGGGSGGGAGGCEDTIVDSVGNSRMTLLMRNLFPNSEGRRFSVLVESKALDATTPPAPISVEVSRYQSPNGLFAEAGGAALATKIR